MQSGFCLRVGDGTRPTCYFLAVTPEPFFVCENILSVKFSGVQIVAGQKMGADIQCCFLKCSYHKDSEEFGREKLSTGGKKLVTELWYL